MTLLSPTWTAILYLIAAVSFILALKGLSSPKTARRGNLIEYPDVRKPTGPAHRVGSIEIMRDRYRLPWGGMRR